MTSKVPLEPQAGKGSKWVTTIARSCVHADRVVDRPAWQLRRSLGSAPAKVAARVQSVPGTMDMSGLYKCWPGRFPKSSLMRLTRSPKRRSLSDLVAFLGRTSPKQPLPQEAPIVWEGRGEQQTRLLDTKVSAERAWPHAGFSLGLHEVLQ